MKKIANGLELPDNLGELVNPKRCALIVYDMQAGIVKQVKEGAVLTAAVQRVLYASRAAGMRIFHTRHLSLPRELMGAYQYRMAMSWQRLDDPTKVQPWFLRDSPSFQLIPELQPLPSEGIFDKLAMSAFEGTPLEMAMRDCEIRSFLIMGVALEIGIDITCRHAADLGFVPIVIEDACGWGNQEAAERALQTLKFLGDAVITDSAAVINALGLL